MPFSMDELRIIIDYYSKHPPPWTNYLPSGPKKRKMDLKDVQIVEDVLRSLTLATEHFRRLWNWSEFANNYLNHNDTYIVWLACQCMAIILQLTESEKDSLVYRYMDEETNVKHMLLYNSKPMLNHEAYLKTYTTNQYTTVEGVLLPIAGSSKQDEDLVLVDSTKHNLRNLSIAVSAGKVACLVGPVGSGKTALVHYLANITGHTEEKLLTIQLGDETDSKMMLGSYHCTDIPGEFVWQPGALTKAVTEGKWLLLEDIDSASSDLAAVLVSLIESRSLTVPGFRDNIVPETGFQLFLTQRVLTTISGYYHKQNIATDLLGKHYIQINVEPLSKNELIEVVETKFPVLKTIAARIIDVFLIFSAGLHNSDIILNFKSNDRLTSTRDLMKWCNRIVKEYTVTSSESALKVIQDAIDIFCCSTGDYKLRIERACHVASLIGIVKTKAEFFLNEYKPTIKLDEKYCVAGRITLPRTGSFLTENDMPNSKFALTRNSSCLIERIACCILAQESVLLVGETGTGKTSTLQLLAKHTGNNLIVLNMNQQSDSVDLIGGYKPVELKVIVKPVREEFESLFRSAFEVEKNTKFLGHISTCFNNRQWLELIQLMKHVIEKAINKNVCDNKPRDSWLELSKKISRLQIKLKHSQTAMAFSFVEGSLIRAVKEGHWVLLDEINLASAETLQCLSSLLESNGTVTIYEKADSKPIHRHPNFRLMAAMNPATDVGKKDLPPGIRNRFTEFFVDELTERSDLITLTACYLPDYSAQKLNAISKFYLIAKREAETFLVDGTGHKPHYSLRTYCRALSIASLNPCQSVQRSLYEAFCLSFLTQLDSSSHERVESLIATTMFAGNLIQGVLNQPIPIPITKTQNYIKYQGYWIPKGDGTDSLSQTYVLTESVRKNLCDIIRAVSLSCFPVLIQGSTSVGKTSLITFLAAVSRNTLVRINNHEHTDLQEYIGSYSADSVTGQLTFKEGVLVQAMRKGHWIVLDELNLAPSDVLEALNRVLDDNRELFIPETQTTVKADPRFRLFATQNPPGLYGGRKMLSRAFKNRFIEMHFDEIPANELEVILYKRCEIPYSYAKRVVSVMKELQSTRKGSAAFAGKEGFITLRDLFRWGERYRLAPKKDDYDWNQHLVDEGFLVLASKVRKYEEQQTILQTLEKHFNCPLSLDRLFTLNENTSSVTRHILEKLQSQTIGFEHVFMSKNIRRMIVLAYKAIEFKEPILLVGETGVGKTTVCQLIAAIRKQKLLTVNCHQHTESSDFLGGLRPVRNKGHSDDQRLFEWVDGPLIDALIGGHMFLADEISLADDSVLERFNSLLEPERKLLLSEKIVDNNSGSELVAHSEFCFISTMNPGGDYGKKELSPALRNRLTEIWCENCSDDKDLVLIVNHNFPMFSDYSLFLSQSMVEFVNWLKKTDRIKDYLNLNISIRDYLIWVKFIESMMSHLSSNDNYYNSLSAFIIFYIEGATMTFLGKKTKSDQLLDHSINCALKDSLTMYCPKTNLETMDNDDIAKILFGAKLKKFFPFKCASKWFGFDGYYILRGNLPYKLKPKEFFFDASTTKQNAIKILRCMQIDNRAILLEGSPGVGKTSLIQAIAKASGHKLTRINLSEQTDVSDLFGADLPTDGGSSCCFEWRDGPFLRALKEGDWILLDELNLASQSVLEGLNAVLDHRGELYIPELGRSFIIKSKKTRLFACQNPMNEGGARKGLPKSFLNRFLQVYLNKLDCSDIVSIVNTIYTPAQLKSIDLKDLVDFTLNFCDKQNMYMNFRDILRWVDVTIKLECNVLEYLPLIFTSHNDTLRAIENEEFYQTRKLDSQFQKCEFLKVFPSAIMFNRIVVPRKRAISMPVDESNNKLILRLQIPILNSLAVCMKMNWMPILIGSGSGKTSVIKTLAQLCGNELRVLSVNAAMDTIEILGGFEQADFNRHLEELAKKLESAMFFEIGQQIMVGENDYISLLNLWNEYKQLTATSNTSMTTMASETTLFKKRIVTLIQISNSLGEFDMSYSLQNLGERICATGDLNSGGKFEWIDSILVKCLKDGCWLLIDNVNLCSPAVIDRLNGLLEPNGVLELGEKGIDSDGQITTIKPHKDFRLFLAMDPKHGSISRAMKNRGVEIYMNPLEEISNYDDVQSMLELQGICNTTIGFILIEIHTIMRNVGTGTSINHLLRTAYLVSQNIKRHRFIVQTIQETCIDTYARCLNENAKKIALVEISILLKKYREFSSDIFYLPNLKTMEVLQSSSLCYIKQQCTVFKQYELISDVNIEDLLLCYFGRSSSSDISIRSQWLAEQLNCDNEAIKHFIKQPQKLNFDMLNFVNKSVNYIDQEDLPYDFRYLPNVYSKNKCFTNTTPLAENKIHLMLDHALNRALDENFTSTIFNQKKIMVAEGGIFHDYAILSITFNDFVDYFMSETSLNIDESSCVLFKEVINCTRIIEKKLFTVLNQESELVTVLIYCYFGIVVKYFVNMMEVLTSDTRHAYLEQLITMKNQILKNYLTPKRYAKLLKSVSKSLNTLSYQCCQEHGDINILVYRQNNDLMSTIKSNIQTLMTHEFKSQRNNLLMINFNSCDQLRDADYKNFERKQMSNMELNLIPLWEIIIQRNLLAYDYTEEETENTYDDEIFLKLVLQFLPTVSPNFFYSIKDSDSFPAEYLIQALKHSMSSVAVENPKLYLEWQSSKMEMDMETKDNAIDEEMQYSFEQPLLTVFITNLLLKKTEPFYTFLHRPIRLIDSNTHNLSCIKSFIWNNSKWTSNIQFNDVDKFEKMMNKIFSLFLPRECTSLDLLHIKRDDEFYKNSVAANVNHHTTMINAIYDAANELSTIRTYNDQISQGISDVEFSIINTNINHSAGRLWVLSGMCLLEVFLGVSPIDPLQKVKVKNECYENEKINLKSRCFAEQLFCKVDGTSDLYPFKEYYMDRFKALEVKVKKTGYRPSPPLYSVLLKEINRFSSMFGLDSNTYNLINSDCTSNTNLIVEIDNWLSSVTNFHDSLEQHYAKYPDLLSGILLSINLMRYGMRMLKNYYKWTHQNKNTTYKDEELLTVFGEFPRFCPNIIEMISMDEVVSMNINDKFRWYKLCLEELNNMLYLSGQSYRVDRYKSIIGHVLIKFVDNFNRLLEEKEKKKCEEDNLYKQKSMCETVPLDTEIAQGVARQFPVTKCSDFNDIEGPNTLDFDSSQVFETEEVYSLSDKDIRDICQLHTELTKPGAVAHWLTLFPAQFDQNEATLRLKNSYSDRFCLFGKLLMSKFMYLNVSMDSKMLPWLIMATDIANSPINNDIKEYYDFYRDPNIKYAKKTYEVLLNVELKIKQLLFEWPDHPTLLTIMKVVERIMNFDWASPTCRFLIGLELLLTKLHEWEEVAHRGVSVNELSLTITDCIQEYRNLELNTWKNCLKTSHKTLTNDSSKWWFHLYSIFQAHQNKQNSLTHLVKGIQQFMENSTLGQYLARLELIYTFHCDVVCQKTNNEQIELCNVSWNLYQYYSQFKDSINIRVETLSKDIKKKLEDFIKIVKWNDINYWSVKETVTKVQQTLHKYTREYIEVLNNPASFGMITDSSIANTNVDPYILPILKSDNYLEKFVVTLDVDVSEQFNILFNPNKYSKKLFTFSGKIMTNCSYPTNIMELNDHINYVMISAKELRDLNVNPNAPKNKQKSQAKQIMQQKRKALSELFKFLQRIGLSYKSGLMGCEQMDCSVEFAKLPPLDIKAALEYLSPKVVDNDLSFAWSDSELYFLKSVSQTIALGIASETPKLGQQEMDRIKGFTNDLKNVTWNTKKILASQIDSLTKFRSMLYLSDVVTNSDNVVFDPTEDFQQPINYIMNSINILQQFKVAILCFSKNINATSNDPLTTLIDIVYDSVKMETTDEIIDSINVMISDAQTALESIFDKKTFYAMKLSNVNFMTSEKYEAALVISEQLKEYINKLYKHVWINGYNTMHKHDVYAMHFNSDPTKPSLDKVNSLVNQVLRSVEKLYKKHSELPTENEDAKLLKCLIIEPLSADLNDCDLTSINEQLKNVLKLGTDDQVLRSCLPFFEQYALLVQYFITQQTMVYRVLSKMNYLLASLFTDLTSNGFCLPDDLFDGDDVVESDGKSGMGLTEGEGSKDVSDQIDSQDQLEDAKKDYNDQPPESEKDLTEEEKGVEMSDDFDGKLHDLDNDDANSSDNENDDFDQDKEMGETGEGAETLDEKLWGSDSDDEDGEDQENQDLKEEDGKGGESMGDKQIGAKSELENMEELDDKEERSQQNSHKDINELDEDGDKTGEDHTDPLHNELKPPPEPEAMDLPNDIQLDEGEMNDDENCEENPFDIDLMRENTDTFMDNMDDEHPVDDLEKDPKDLEDTDDEDDIGNEIGNEIDDSNCKNDEKFEEDETKENDEPSDGGKKDDKKTGEDPREEEKEPNTETAKPSEDNPSQIETQPSSFDNSGSKDQVCDKTNEQNDNENIEKSKEESTGPEQQGIGRSQGENKDTQEGHNVNEDQGSQSAKSGTKDKKRRMKPGERNLDRTLAESDGPLEKRLKTTHAHDENIDSTDEDENHDDSDNKKGELFKHVKDSKKSDTETLDAATNEQLEKKPMPNNENEKGDDLKEDDEIELEEDVNEKETQSGEEILPEKTKPTAQKQSSTNDVHDIEKNEKVEESIVIDGDIIPTYTVERGIETKYFTVYPQDEYMCAVEKRNKQYFNQEWLTSELYNKMNKNEVWNECIEKTSCLAQELSEQLRLVLEPSKASRLQGDFRTGRRINMRRVIPYIASQFKKDKIWLRRTKPSKRQYQIIMSVDNSCSMKDSRANLLAIDALALVSKALSLVEAGELGVMSFGENSRILHPLGETFSDETGAKLVTDFVFDEQKTKVGELIELATAVFEERGRLDTSDRPAQLLVIISDGRGINCEGPDYVKNAIRAARLTGIFIVFIVVDNPASKESIMDMKIPKFEDNSVRIESYMDNFPFPFYVILRDVDKLPGVLSDALREWFELVTN